MDITRVNRISYELQAILWSIVNNSGSTMDQLVLDTKLKTEVITQTIDRYLRRGKIRYNSGKYYISNIQDWRFWKDEVEFLNEENNFVRRSLYLQKSPVKDWWPANNQPRPGLIYYIGPYREPYLSLYFDLIKPLIEILGYECSTSLEEVGSEEFLRKKILPGLKNARFVLCNLSEENPNVHYEFGWLNAFGTPFYAFQSDICKKRSANIHHLTIDDYNNSRVSISKLVVNIITSMKNSLILCPNEKDYTTVIEDLITAYIENNS